MKTLIALIALATSTTAFAQVKPADDAPPKIEITKEQNDDLKVTVEASEAKPTDVSIDLDGKGFVFFFRFYATNTFKVFPSIRHQPTVLFKAEKGQKFPGEIAVDVQLKTPAPPLKP